VEDMKGSISARGLGLRTRAGWVYRDIDWDVPGGSLAVVTGPAGSGKTALLLTLAARMQASQGTLTVAGLDVGRHAGAVRHSVGLGEFRGVNDLDDTLGVGDQVMAELALHGKHWRGAHVGRVLEPLGLELEPHRKVRDLSAPDRLLLGVALGAISRPPVVIVDELDEDTTPDETQVVFEALRRLTHRGTTVIAGALDPALAAAADHRLALDADGAPIVREEVLTNALV